MTKNSTARLPLQVYIATAGKKVAVLESRVVGGGQSGKDTGEITTYNTHTYKRLESLYGAEKTSRIAASQKAALEFVEDVVKKKRINCGFSRQDAFVFFDSPSVGPEFKAILNAGLRDTQEVRQASVCFCPCHGLRQTLSLALVRLRQASLLASDRCLIWGICPPPPRPPLFFPSAYAERPLLQTYHD